MSQNLQNDQPYTEEDLRWKELDKIGAIVWCFMVAWDFYQFGKHF